MSANRTSMHRLQELVRLHRMGGEGVHDIAGALAMSPNTERRYRTALSAAGLLAGSPDALPELEELRAAVERALPRREPPQQRSSLVEWEPTVTALVKAGLEPKAIHDRLRLEEPTYAGRIGAMKRLVRRIRLAQGVSPADVAIPVDTRPGLIAQVDFGYGGMLWDPETQQLRRAWIFVMVLGHSRHMYVEYTFDQTAETWVRLHVNAFRSLDGVPEELVPDNLKAAVLQAAFSSAQDATLNRTYRELARHYGFKIAPTPPRSPKKKGKVESGVKYVKNNFGKGRQGSDINVVNAEAARWVREIAGTRDHGTTGRAPLAVFEQEEQQALLPLPRDPYRIVVWHKATVHQDCHFYFDGRLYSVPWHHVAPKGLHPTVVWARATASTVTAYIDDVRVTDHDRNGPGRRSTKEAHLPEYRRDHRHRDPEYWRERAHNLGAGAAALIDALLHHDPAKSRVDVACSTLKLLEGLTTARAESVARHALQFGNVHYREIKRIVEYGLDQQDASEIVVSDRWSSAPPAFARSGEEFLNRILDRDANAPAVVSGTEVDHGCA